MSGLYHDVLDLLEERPMTARAIADALLVSGRTIDPILGKALLRGQVVLLAPTPDHPVVRVELSDAEIRARLARLRRWRPTQEMKRRDRERFGALVAGRGG